MKAWRKLPEGVLAEVIDDRLYILASPSPYHGRISLRLACELDDYVRSNELGEVFHSPIDVHLRKGGVVIPDILFVAKGNDLTVNGNGLHGIPDLHIEILSPNNKAHDLITKKELYENAGVKEYWIIDQLTKESWGYLLENNHYDEPLVMNSEVHIRILNKAIKF